jgi:transposase
MNVLGQAYEDLAEVDTLIKTLIALSYAVHADETSMKVAEAPSRKGWLHVAATTTLTSYHAHVSRGLEAVREHGVLKHCAGVLVHDSLSMYDSVKLAGKDADGEPIARYLHQLCAAHICRELVAAGERHPGENWPHQAERALYALNDAAHEARDQGRDTIEAKVLKEQVELFHHAVLVGLAGHPRDHTRREQSKTRNLLERLRDREIARTTSSGSLAILPCPSPTTGRRAISVWPKPRSRSPAPCAR